MASTYSNSGIELIANGEQSGTWGDTTNVNLQIIDRLINGVGSISLSGTTHTLTTSDGSLSDGQYRVLVFGGSPSGTNTVTISPNDATHLYFVRNASGQSVVLTQGSGGNVTIANGDTKVVYSDGAGAGAAVVDITNDFAMGSVNITGGTIDGTVIGGATPAAITGTTGTFSGNLTVDTNTLFVDAASNSVGIGTSLPASYAGFTTLNIKGAGVSTGGVIQLDTSDASKSAQMYVDTVGLRLATTTSHSISLFTDNAERLRIDSSGSLLVGTTSAISSAKFTVNSTSSVRFNLASDGTERFGVYGDSGVAALYAGSGIPMTFTTGGSERLRIDASGNLGLGVTPSAWDGAVLTSLQVKSAALSSVPSGANDSYLTSNAYYGSGAWRYIQTSTATQYRQSLGAHSWSIAGSGTAGNAITFTQAMTLDASGNLLAGTTTLSQPTNTREILVSREETGGSGRFVAKGGPASFTTYAVLNSGSHDGVSTHYSPYLVFTEGLRFFSAPLDQEPNDANLTERMRLDSSGNLLVGTTSGSDRLNVYQGAGGTIATLQSAGTTGAYAIQFQNPNGTVGNVTISGTTTSYNTSSDYRLKEGVQPMVGASDRVLALNPVNFAWKADGSRTDGFLAHEAQAVVPEAVVGEKDAVDADGNPVYQGIDQSKLVPLLTAALQEALTEIANLKARVAALEA